MEFEDKTILALFFSLILVIFLDHQAKKQQSLIRNSSIRKISIDELVQGKTIPSKVKEKVENKLENIYAESRDVLSKTHSMATKQIEKIQTDVKKKSKTLKEILEEKTNNPYLNNVSMIQLPLNKEITQLELFFPKFVHKKTEMYRVIRKIKGKVTPTIALKILQKGPDSNEKGFVNAFYEGINLETILYENQHKRIHLFFEKDFMSSNPMILKDRIDQICLTLKQFSAVHEIYFWIEKKLYVKMRTCSRKIKNKKL